MYKGGINNNSSDDVDYSIPSDVYSWYCRWEELQPFWKMLVPNEKSRVVIAGIVMTVRCGNVRIWIYEYNGV